MIHKRSQLYMSLLGTTVLFLVLLAAALASTTWAAPGEQGTIGKPTETPMITPTKPGEACDDCQPGPTPTATPLPKLPTTGGSTDGGIWVIGLPLLAVLGAGLAWQGLRMARR